MCVCARARAWLHASVQCGCMCVHLHCLYSGPVAPSDAVGGVDIDLIMSLCRRDGLLLKPDVPAMPVDSTWKYRVFGGEEYSREQWYK